MKPIGSCSILLVLISVCSAVPTELQLKNDLAHQLANETKQEAAVGCQKDLLYPEPMDCEEVRRNGHNVSGVYKIYLRHRVLGYKSLHVNCDMETAGGGWTIVQSRGDFNNREDYFYKTWAQYKKGFGQLGKDFWIGNDNIYVLTNQGSYSVRFDLVHANGTSAYAEYDTFWIEDERQKYKLYLTDYFGNAGDGMKHHNGMIFLARDQSGSATQYKSGWWHMSSSHYANLNGLYKKDQRTGPNNVMSWDFFGGNQNCLASSEIKIRPIGFN